MHLREVESLKPFSHDHADSALIAHSSFVAVCIVSTMKYFFSLHITDPHV